MEPSEIEILVDKGKNRSHHDGLNFLAKKGKVYLMDNHLAAFYAWSKELDPMGIYRLLHIDNHHDLGDGLVKTGYHAYKSLIFSSLGIAEMLSLKADGFQLLQWDNYIELYRTLNPFSINEIHFITPQRLSKTYQHFGQQDLASWIKVLRNPSNADDLNKMISTYDIINIDIDAFIQGNEKSKKRIKKTDLKELVKWIFEPITELQKPIFERAKVVTIALSPECCGGWENAISMFLEFDSLANLGFENLPLITSTFSRSTDH